MSQRFCTSCGEPVEFAFCSSCGAPVADGTAVADGTPMAGRPAVPEAPRSTDDTAADQPAFDPGDINRWVGVGRAADFTAMAPPVEEDLPYAAPASEQPTYAAPAGRLGPEPVGPGGAPLPAAATGAPLPRRRNPVAIGIGVAVVLGLVVAGIVGGIAFFGDEPEAGATPQRVEPERSILGQPEQEWRKYPSDFMRDSYDAEFSALELVDGGSIRPLFLPDAVVFAVVSYDPVTTRRIIALDPTTGELLWDAEGLDANESWVVCEPVQRGESLVCWTQDYEAGSTRMEVRDVATGKVLAEERLDVVVTNVVGWGDEVYTLGSTWKDGTRELEATVTRGTVDDLAGAWQETLSDVVPVDYDSEFYDQLVVGPDSLSVTWGPWTTEVDKEDGDQLGEASETAGPPRLFADGSRVTHDWEAESSVFTDGDTERTFPGDAWRDMEYLPYRSGDLMGFGDTMFDVSTGEAEWSMELEEYDQVQWLNDDTLWVSHYVEDGDNWEEIRDASTGDVLWHPASGSRLWGQATTSDAVVLWDSEGNLNVVDIRTGVTAWDRALGQLEYADDGSSSWLDDVHSGTTTEGLVALSRTTMWGFSGFADVERADVAEGTGEGVPAELGADSYDDETPELGSDYVTDCGSEPELVAVEAASDTGGVEVTFELHATCPDGQWLDGSAYRITVTGDPSGDGASTQLAHGLFDFTDNPVWVTPDDENPSRLHAYFPVRQVWATAQEINDAIGNDTTYVDCEREEGGGSDGDTSGRDGTESGADDGDAGDSGDGDAGDPDGDDTDGDTSDGGSGDDGDSAGTDSGDGGEQLAPADPDAPDEGAADTDTTDEVTDPQTREENSLAALRRRRNEDKLAATELVGSWVPQLSSKKLGTYDRVDDRTYDYTAIYEEHLRLALLYPNVRLLWSTDWNSFERKGYWVTVAGISYDSPEEANAWCDAQGITNSHCFAKKITTTGGTEGTTRMRK